jgi:hypothetical protein
MKIKKGVFIFFLFVLVVLFCTAYVQEEIKSKKKQPKTAEQKVQEKTEQKKPEKPVQVKEKQAEKKPVKAVPDKPGDKSQDVQKKTEQDKKVKPKSPDPDKGKKKEANPDKKKIADKKPEIRSLIRTDLLNKKKKKLKPPRRNIFSPHKTISPAQKARQEAARRQAEARAKQEAEGGSEGGALASGINLNLRYIGYVHSETKDVALIILAGEAQAVAEGDVVGEGLRVGAITLKELEVIAMNSKKRKYPLEGDEE